jgi:branched-chain amino acid aminotransferase
MPMHACMALREGLVIELCKANNILVEERNLSLTEFYTADEVFGTGTMGELTPVTEIDGRKITNRSTKSLLKDLREKFKTLIPKYSEKLPF